MASKKPQAQNAFNRTFVRELEARTEKRIAAIQKNPYAAARRAAYQALYDEVHERLFRIEKPEPEAKYQASGLKGAFARHRLKRKLKKKSKHKNWPSARWAYALDARVQDLLRDEERRAAAKNPKL